MEPYPRVASAESRGVCRVQLGHPKGLPLPVTLTVTYCGRPRMDGYQTSTNGRVAQPQRPGHRGRSFARLYVVTEWGA